MFARPDWVDIIHPDQAQYGRDRAGNTLAQYLAVGGPIQAWRRQRGYDADRNPYVRTGCIDGKLSRVLERQHALMRDAPFA